VQYVCGGHVISENTYVDYVDCQEIGYQHNDQRGQPGGVNVTPSLSFSADRLGTPARLTQALIGDINSDPLLPFVVDGKSIALQCQ